MSISYLSSRVWPGTLLLLLAGCTVGPDFHRPDVLPPVTSFSAHARNSLFSTVSEDAVSADWWSLFDDPLLVSLEQRALAHNLDLAAATSRIAQARAGLRIAGAEGMPVVGANAASLRQRNSDHGPIPSPAVNDDGSAVPYNVWQYGFDASWELDLWGRARRMKEAAGAMDEAALYDAHAVRVSIAAEVARCYMELRGVQSTLRISREQRELSQNTLRLVRRRQDNGIATRTELAQSTAQLAAIEASIPLLEQRLAALKNALAQMAGAAPHALDAELSADAAVPALPAVVPVGLPSALARRRPDILRAEAELHAATAHIGIAKADFYPSISLTGSLGLQAMNFSESGQWGARQFSIGPVLNLPLFDGGRLRGTLQLTEARQQEAAIRFQRTVLGAWHEVDDALSVYRQGQERHRQLEVTVAQSRIALDAEQRRYAQGATDMQAMLAAQQRLLDSQTGLNTSRTSMNVAVITLYKALGGGWE